MGAVTQCQGFALNILHLKKNAWGIDETKLPNV